MSNFKQEDSVVDFAQYFNMDQAASSAHAQNGKTVVSPPQFTAPGPENAFVQPQHLSQQFQGPSHQYELFRQHSSLPHGAMQNVMPQRSRQMMPQHAASFGMGSNSLYDISELDNNPPMDLDLNDFFTQNNSSLDGYLDPNSVAGGGSDVGDASPIAAPVQRLYPGSHQQAAKAQQQEQQRRLQEQHQKQQKAVQHQQQQIGHQRGASHGRNKSVDPAVEEQITQILKRIRTNSQNSRAAHSETPQPNVSQPSKSKKDEEDMDEDERLLASEEGKKLSSKERRQLRNKVSARAFRSRRKEYISQLEGEISAKNGENDDLRHDNDMLRTENAQLTDLVRMLLGHHAFGSVVEDLSSRGAQVPFLPIQQAQGQSQQMVQKQQSQQQQQQQQHRASVAMSQSGTQGSSSQATPTAMDFASTPVDGWNSGLPAPEFNFNPSVFAVSELPEHPAIEPEVLAGKSSESSILPLPSLPSDEKETKPVIERPLPKADRPVIASREEEESPDSLYAEPTPKFAESAENLTTSPLVEKPTNQFELVSFEEVERSEAMVEARFAALCERLDAVSERISRITGSN